MPEVTMPRLSDTMQEGTIARWLKKPGDRVERGDVLAEIETDKATMELQAYESGVLEKILVQEGESAPIGQVIALIGSGATVSGQEETSVGRPASQTTTASSTAGRTTGSGGSGAEVSQEASSSRQRATAPVEVPSSIAPVGQENGDRVIKASPLARRLAEEHNIDLRQIRGSGPGGRIVRDDIEAFLESRRTATVTAPAEAGVGAAPVPPVAAPAAAAEVGAAPAEELVPLSRMQATIARRLTESKQTIPHFYVSTEIDMTEALALRRQLNESAGEGGVKVSVNDLIIKACALALEKFPEVNSSYRDGQFVRHQAINIGIAVDIPNGLVVPVVRDANLKGVRTIAREARALIEKAHAGKLTPADLSGGTFSISNMGMLDVSEFIAVINPPEAAIMAVASVRRTFVPINDQPVLRDMMHVTVSADHRILYGATVARFLQEVKRLLQNPFSLLG
ncbi:MAG: pyruvate dehydrogenase complex dihydrolipoamide acetyltransferase [Thermogemmatispora sp.]|uniref:pyruvate dehydrogenase complex dihydrolipoamide acetyltransferase n=1 Tax=Thermogemmatispora sp. TaxID=1968838 RepID=UPI00261C9C28|nr:pyruvate dehydrogenase complex dihydrolipoamide acetyltransferase [Thermogemmatispora sp.]MBX5459315.1 pyruvate dehydrogenase complex dihydrolipoamide acetyltransferase [Thermogemmatispora sp.]